MPVPTAAVEAAAPPSHKPPPRSTDHRRAPQGAFHFEAENNDHRALLSSFLPGGGSSPWRRWLVSPRRRWLLSPAAAPELEEDLIAFSFSFEGLDGFFLFFLGT
jgi:hypothetical protein